MTIDQVAPTQFGSLNAPRGPQEGENTFRWATVTSNPPLRIRLDGETDPLPITPDVLLDSGALNVGQRVWTQLFGRRAIILGGSELCCSANDVPEYGVTYAPAATDSTSTTFVTLLSFTLPSAGTWDVTYFARATHSNLTGSIYGYVALFDNSGTVIPDSEMMCRFLNIATSNGGAQTGTGRIFITTTGAATFTLRGASGGAYTTTWVSNNAGRTGVAWARMLTGPRGLSGATGVTIQDENGNIGTGITQIDFQGAGVTSVLGSGEVVVTIPGAPSITVQDENSNVATGVTQIDFQGAGVTVTPGSGEVIVTIPGPTGITVQDENGAVATGVTQIDFQGAGVTATPGTGEVIVTIPGGGAGGGVTIQDENGNIGTGITQIDFQGAGVAATLGSGEAIITIPAVSLADGMRVVEVGEDIQAAIDVGPGAVFLKPGTHNRTTGLLMRKDVTLMGSGGGTRIKATSAMTRLIDASDVDAIRYNIRDMVIDCNGLATIGIDNRVNFTGTSVDSEPDCISRLDNLWVYDATDIGVRYGISGGDVQNMITTRVRVRRAGNFGFWCGDSTNPAPDNMWAFCDATTSNSTPGTGFFCGSANCHYVACKAWYTRGYGWHIKSTRCTYTACESQDTKLHGWYIEWDKNQFVNCVADSASYWDVGGTLNGADGFYVESGLSKTTLVSCAAFNRSVSGSNAQQRYGFNLPASMAAYIDATKPGLGSLVNGLFGYDNATATFNWR